MTEALFERALLPNGNDARKLLVELHARVDQSIEMPAILAVLVSGALLGLQAPASNRGFHLMLAAGAVALVGVLTALTAGVWGRGAP